MASMGVRASERLSCALALITGLLLTTSSLAGVSVPTPEVRQSAWQCRAAPEADWLCQRQPGGRFEYSLEQVARPSVPQSNRDPMTWPKKGFTIQLIAVSQTQSLNRLRQQHPQLLRATEVKVQIKGKPLHLLLWGQYPNRAAAKAALERFSTQPLEGIQPWIRPLENLQRLQPQLIARQP